MQEDLGFAWDVPLLGWDRLTRQKGLDLLSYILDELMTLDGR